MNPLFEPILTECQTWSPELGQLDSSADILTQVRMIQAPVHTQLTSATGPASCWTASSMLTVFTTSSRCSRISGSCRAM